MMFNSQLEGKLMLFMAIHALWFSGDSISLSQSLYSKYKPVMQSGFHGNLQQWAGEGDAGWRKAEDWLLESWGRSQDVSVALL